MKLLTVSQVAEMLQCGVSTVYALVSSGKLGGFRIGPNHGGIRIDERDVQAYLDSARMGPKEAPPPRVSRRLKHLRL